MLAGSRSVARIGERLFLPSVPRTPPMSTELVELGAVPDTWTRRHLLDLESLSAEELNIILDAAASFKDATDGCKNKIQTLSGKTCANLFFENSTRTRTSFSLAARRLGAD